MADHLVRQSHSWCFRMIVPCDLREVVGKSELRYTLNTGSRRKAKKFSNRIAGDVKSLFRRLRHGGLMAELSKDEIIKMVREYVDLNKAEKEKESAQSGWPDIP